MENPKYVDQLLKIKDQIKQGSSFISTLIANTFRALDIVKLTWMKHLEYYVSIL